MLQYALIVAAALCISKIPLPLIEGVVVGILCLICKLDQCIAAAHLRCEIHCGQRVHHGWNCCCVAAIGIGSYGKGDRVDARECIVVCWILTTGIVAIAKVPLPLVDG